MSSSRGGRGAERVVSAAILAASILLILANAGVYTYYPVFVNINPVEPPVWFLPPLSDATASIGVNGTEANVTALLSATNLKLIDNPGFDNSADPWLCGPVNRQLDCYYLATDTTTGDTGIVSIYGVASGTNYTYIVQVFTVPTDIATVNYAVRYRLASSPFISINYLVVGVYNLSAGGTLIDSASTLIGTSTTYTWFNGTLIVNLRPGYDYAFIVGIYYIVFLFPGTMDLRIDYADLTTDTPTTPAFDGELVRINVSQDVAGRLLIENYTVNGISGSVYIEGSDGSIGAILLNGTGINSTTTKWVPLNVTTNPLYVPGRVLASVTGNAGSQAYLEGYLEWRVGGVTVRYPLRVNITG